MQAPYTQPINSLFPGLFVVMIDQSKSMEERFGGSQKHIFAANAINKVIYEIRSAAIEGSEIKDRCFVIVIGYGSETKALISHPTSKLKEKILRVDEIEATQSDGSVINMRLPIYIEPKAENGTPMDAAFNLAYDLCSAFCHNKKYQENFPPIVINITDGMPNDLQRSGSGEQTRDAAKRLLTLGTQNGNLLLFNAHIGSDQYKPVLLPSDEKQLEDHYAKYLFEFTSPIPQPLIKLAEMAGFEPKLGARGLVFNADAAGFIKLLEFGSSKSTYD